MLEFSKISDVIHTQKEQVRVSLETRLRIIHKIPHLQTLKSQKVKHGLYDKPATTDRAPWQSKRIQTQAT